MNIARKYPILKYPCILMMLAILAIYHGISYIRKHFAGNGRRYISIAFSLLFFMSSCSFSFAVFSGQSGFIDAQAVYHEVVEEDSGITLAIEKEVTLDDTLLPEKVTAAKEYENTEDIVNSDTYTLEDILEDSDSYTVEDGDGSDDKAMVEETSEPVFDSSDWKLVLVNKQHPIPDDYSFNLGIITGGLRCDERIIPELLSMLQAAKDDGINLMIKSPYRTDDRQENNFNQRIKEYMQQGYSYMEAYKTTSRVIAIPGASEHQIGLALDITCDTYSPLKQGFGETDAGLWLAEHSCEYGFILRYPEGKEYFTSIEYEPWHFRYVGKEAAVIMTQENLCLEEFWDKYL
ncbi:MAG: M15 family metallopeptidase [Muribaculaceae bacterium]|nr:M15 family metallopeptidase [Muribaculaceae bacterium]